MESEVTMTPERMLSLVSCVRAAIAAGPLLLSSVGSRELGDARFTLSSLALRLDPSSTDFGLDLFFGLFGVSFGVPGINPTLTLIYLKKSEISGGLVEKTEVDGELFFLTQIRSNYRIGR